MKVVVTGASGHLGRYVVAELLQQGHEVVAASRSGKIPPPPFGEKPTQGRLRGLALDLMRDEAVSVLARELNPEVALVHIAAWHPPSTANTSADDRDTLLEVNVLGTMRVLESARRSANGVACVVYASTFEVYAELDGNEPALTETSRVAPATDYGATKLSGEDHLIAFSDEEQTRIVALRLPAIYGPGETTSRALPNFLRAVARGERPVIYGDGADLRDQIHVRDAAMAFGLAISGKAAGIFNVADGQAHSIAEIARLAMEISSMPGSPDRKERVKARCDYHMSTDKARTGLGFVPRIELKTGMGEELAFIRASA